MLQRARRRGRARRPAGRRRAGAARGRRLPGGGGARCATRSPSAAGRRRRASATTRSRCCAPGPSAAGASRSRAAQASTASASRPTAVTSRFPALGAITGDWGGGYDVGMAGALRGRAQRGRPRADDAPRAARAGAFRLRRAVERRARDPRRRAARAARRSSSRRSCCGGGGRRGRRRDRRPARRRDRRARARDASTRLGLLDEQVEVVVGGGLMRSADRRLLARDRGTGCASVGPRVVLRRTSAPPIVGAALLGLDALGADAVAQARAARASSARRSSGSRRLEVALMADVRYEQATRIYPGTECPAVDALDLEIARRRVPRPRRPVGLGQDDGAADARRARGGRRGRDLHRRPRRHRPAAEAARRRDGVPELRALPVPHRRREHRVSAARSRSVPKAERDAARARGRGAARARAVPRAQARPALGRPAPARRDGPRDHPRSRACS